MVKLYKMCIEDIPNNLTDDFDDFWNPSMLESEINNPNSYCFVAKDDEKIVGFFTLWESVDDIHLTNIVVKKDLRNNGIATIMLKYAIDFVRKSGKSSLTLEVNENNIYAKKLYLKSGFKILGIRKKYYNNTDDAIIMTLEF